VGKPHVSKSLDSGFRRNDVLHFGNPLRHSGGSRNPVQIQEIIAILRFIH